LASYCFCKIGSLFLIGCSLFYHAGKSSRTAFNFCCHVFIFFVFPLFYFLSWPTVFQYAVYKRNDPEYIKTLYIILFFCSTLLLMGFSVLLLRMIDTRAGIGLLPGAGTAIIAIMVCLVGLSGR